ncbi:MAG: PriCT-2 domain-containing protein [Pirellulales bacterium]|nr:PriCT-2 domain-containing protein [Pirellulales bacterium]
MVIDVDFIPRSLRDLDRWLGWNWVWNPQGNGGAGKWTKPPVNCRGGAGSSTDASTWCDFATAIAAAEAGEVDGIGIALGDLGDGRVLTGVDCDDCLNPQTGELTPDADAVVAMLKSYVEKSPTGTGVKVFCFGRLPPGRRSRGRFEGYSDGRYFTVTGHELAASPADVRTATTELARFHGTFIEPPSGVARALTTDAEQPGASLVLQALNALNPERADNYEDWLLVGMALHSVDPGLLTEWDRWSQLSVKYTAGECARKWRTFAGCDVGIGSLIHWAIQDGWKPPRRPTGGDDCTDAANAARFARRLGDRVRYVHRWDKFFVFNGRRWKEDTSGEVMRLAKRTADDIYRETSEIPNPDKQKALAAWAKASHSRSRLEAMIELAKSELPIPVSHESLDSHPYLLNCENGTVDLRTGQLRPHDPGDLLTKTTGVEYPDNPGVEAVLWQGFLNAIFAGDVDLIRFLQRLMGSALTGEVVEHLLPIFHGNGANGKSVLIETVMAALGDYAMKAPAGLLMASRGERHPTELADLHGKRLVAITESGEGQRLDERMVKEVTGGDTIRARRMREDFWQFKPSHLAVLVTNHKPVVRGVDYGIWRRLRLVPFDVTIAEADQDKRLPSKLRAELPAILRWMVEGCLAWQRDGLQAPAQVMAATEGYRAESDTFARWFIETIREDPSGEIRALAAFRSYTTWCTDASERPISNRRFGEQMAERIAGRRISNGTYYQGITWLTAPIVE